MKGRKYHHSIPNRGWLRTLSNRPWGSFLTLLLSRQMPDGLETFLGYSGRWIATLEESRNSSFHHCLYEDLSDGEKNASIHMLYYSKVGVFENRKSDQFEENSTYLCFSKWYVFMVITLDEKESCILENVFKFTCLVWKNKVSNKLNCKCLQLSKTLLCV